MPLPPQTTPFSRPKVLIGEGRDEVNFFQSLLTRLGLIDIQVEEYGGKGNLARYVREFGVRPGHENVIALGITRDADASVINVFQSICALLGITDCPCLPRPVRSLPARRGSVSSSCRIISATACSKTFVWMPSRVMPPCPA